MSLATDLRARLAVAEETDGPVLLLPEEARDVLAALEKALIAEDALAATPSAGRHLTAEDAEPLFDAIKYAYGLANDKNRASGEVFQAVVAVKKAAVALLAPATEETT